MTKVTPARAAVLELLQKHGPQGVRELEATDARRQLPALRRAGLVEVRYRGKLGPQDARDPTAYFLTDAGRRALARPPAEPAAPWWERLP